MTITDIDKQFDDKFEYIGIALDWYTNSMYTENKKPGTEHLQDVKDFIHQIYTQAKAEQREKDYLIAEGKILTEPTNWPDTDGAYNQACDDIASEIRGQHECKQTTQESLQVKEQ